MPNASFREIAPHEAGFAEVFARDILPIYRASRIEATALKRRSLRRARIIGGFGLFVVVSLWVRAPLGTDATRWVLPLFPLFLFGILTLVVASSGKGAFNTRIKAQIMPILLRFLGLKAHHPTPDRSFINVDALQKARVFSAFDRLSIQDGLEGDWRGVPFRLAELDLSKRRSSSDEDRNTYDTVFSGLVMEITSPVALPDTVILGKFGDMLDGLVRRFVVPDGFYPVEFETEAELPFVVYSVDPNAARAQFGPLFLEKLRAIAEDQTGEDRRLAAAFDGTQFRLTLHRRAPFLEIDALRGEEAEFVESCRAALADMARPARVIDLLIDGA